MAADAPFRSMGGGGVEPAAEALVTELPAP